MPRSGAAGPGGQPASLPASLPAIPDIFCEILGQVGSQEGATAFDHSICQDEFTVADYVIMAVYGLIIVISLFGNFLVFSVIIKTRRLHTITNLFIANLAFGDLLMTTFNIPFTVVSFVHLSQCWDRLSKQPAAAAVYL